MEGWGYYGKIAGHGDFLRRSLPPAFVSIWDDWLQAGMIRSRDRLGRAWLERYLSAPIWRFALAPGVATPASVIGVMMPSIDRVGRHFPLTIAAMPDAARGPWQALADAATALAQVEEAALATLDEHATRARLDAALAVIPASLPRMAGDDRTAEGLEMMRGNATIAASALADRRTVERHGAAGVWTTGTGGSGITLVSRGLPVPQAFARFLAPDPGSCSLEEVLP